MHCRSEGSAGRERGRRGGKDRSGSDRFVLREYGTYRGNEYSCIIFVMTKWILIRIENWCVRARMDFDSNRRLVPIGSYRFLLMVRTVRTEVTS